MMKTVIFIGMTLLAAAGAFAEPVYYEGCGQLVQGFTCVQFWPIFANPPGGILVPAELGDYGPGDIVYITGEYDPDVVVVECGGSPMISNTIGECLPTGCCQGLKGNIDGDPDDLHDIGDLTTLIDHLFISRNPLPCPEEADFNSDGVVDIGDLTWYIRCLFYPIFECVFPPCPADSL